MSMRFEKLNVLSAYQVVSRELRRMVLTGGLKAGDQLPTETELAQQFGVNRSTVREGIRQLETEGLVRRQGRKRLCVSVPDGDVLAPRASMAMVMHQVTFKELWEVALALEPACASLCAQNRSSDQCAAIEANVEQTRQCIAIPARCLEFDAKFHGLIAEGAQNKAMRLSREPVGLLLHPAFDAISLHLPQAIGRMVTAHERIAAAIVRGNASDAELWMRKHVMDFRRGWELAKLSADTPIELPRALAEA